MQLRAPYALRAPCAPLPAPLPLLTPSLPPSPQTAPQKLLLLQPACAPETTREEIEATFTRLVQRGDVGLIIMNQPVADQVRATVAAHTLSVPMVLEIPAAGGSGAAAAASDPIMKRVLQMLGEGQ